MRRVQIMQSGALGLRKRILSVQLQVQGKLAVIETKIVLFNHELFVFSRQIC